MKVTNVRIEEIADYIWRNSLTISFGEKDAWDSDLFTSKWSKGKTFEQAWKEAGAGWYWFSVGMNYVELHAVEKPQALPDKGCNIGLLAHDNNEVFGNTLLCAHEDSIAVVYNGHEANVTSRIRAHFALNNNGTGALGIKHYPLSQKKWNVRYFSTPCFSTDISSENRMRIKLLMNSYSGRCAVESAWRVKYGWPVLCKE